MIASVQYKRKINGKTVPYDIENNNIREKAKDIASFRIINAKPLNRKVTFHSGPPNSGKTYTALKSLSNARNGIYCAPLRLMAFEIYESLTKKGLKCNLITGEEQILTHSHPQIICCTIEMTNFSNEYDIGIIDEIQMMDCKSRGFAWTRAYLQLNCSELHVCGDLRTLPLLQRISTTLNDVINVFKYQRKTQLIIDDSSLNGNFNHLQPGDAVVVFSRQAVFDLKKSIEHHTSYKCAVIYGKLPPGPRRHQATLFNDNKLKQILVCTDAIGMGLNLNIKRIIFYTLKRKINKLLLPIDHAQVHQIAGRAGRFNIFNQGHVTTFHQSDFLQLQLYLQQTPTKSLRMGFFPSLDQFKRFKRQLPFINSFSRLVMTFNNYAALCEEDAFICDMDGFMKRVALLETVSLKLEDKYYFCCAPCLPNPTLLTIANAFSTNKYIDIFGHLKSQFPSLINPQLTTEMVWDVLDHCRHPSEFVDIANDSLVLFHHDVILNELEGFHQRISLLCYLRYRHEQTKTWQREGYSHFYTAFLLEWLRMTTESCLESIMDQEEETEAEQVRGFADFSGFENALKHYFGI